MTIKLLMSSHGQLLEGIDQMAAVTALLCKSQLMADTAIVACEVFAGLTRGAAAFERIQLVPELLPLPLMPSFE